jgi:hypothetical protein
VPEPAATANPAAGARFAQGLPDVVHRSVDTRIPWVVFPGAAAGTGNSLLFLNDDRAAVAALQRKFAATAGDAEARIGAAVRAGDLAAARAAAHARLCHQSAACARSCLALPELKHWARDKSREPKRLLRRGPSTGGPPLWLGSRQPGLPELRRR